MNASAPAREPLTSDKSGTIGDAIAQTLAPANAFERMLVRQIEQSWERLQRAYEVEERYFHGRNIIETMTTKLAEFKAITRYITDCERAWRHAVLHLEKTQRRRQREANASVKAGQTPKNPPHPAPEATSCPAAAPVVDVSRPHREREGFAGCGVGWQPPGGVGNQVGNPSGVTISQTGGTASPAADCRSATQP